MRTGVLSCCKQPPASDAPQAHDYAHLEREARPKYTKALTSLVGVYSQAKIGFGEDMPLGTKQWNDASSRPERAHLMGNMRRKAERSRPQRLAAWMR
jgi:hypothetical protein